MTVEERALGGACDPALTVDVEEWYHNCWTPDYVDPALRGSLVEELDRFLPTLLDRFARRGLRATFFVLGEIARRLPGRIREVADNGHEVACHGDLHLRANDRHPDAFRRDVARAKSELEQVVGEPIVGFRAPEWSLRRASNPRTRIVAELGFDYDSSLLPTWGAGDAGSASGLRRLIWPDGLSLIEASPTVWGGRLKLPLGGWTGRLLGARRTVEVVSRAAQRRELPLLVVHPWELVDRPCPGLLTGLARFFHEAGRLGFGERFLVAASQLRLDSTLVERLREVGALAPLPDDGSGTGADLERALSEAVA
jgi:hypothetical protein